MSSKMSTHISRHKLHVKKRDGTLVPVSYDAITNRLTDLCDMEEPLDLSIDPRELTEIVIKRIKNGISTSEIDTQISEICSSMIEHPDYSVLASRLVISNHHRDLEANVGLKFSDICTVLKYNKDKRNRPAPLVSEEYFKLVQENKQVIDSIIDLNRDYLIDYFGFKTLYKSYFLKVNCIYDISSGLYKDISKKKEDEGFVVEGPQYLFLRHALSIHKNDFINVKKTYDLISTKHYTPATPTLFNSGTVRPQLFSCFLLNMADSMDGIYKCISDTAKISKWAGGIGISVSDIRANGSYISGTAGHSDGIVPMLKVLNDTARYVNQGGRRNGSFAVYLEPWHADIVEFLECRLNTGSEEMRAKDLFYALWIPDLFMNQLEQALAGDKDILWYLMTPNDSVGLTECYGKEFEKKYLQYVSDGVYVRSIKIIDLWTQIIKTQIETGLPYMLYKDAVNLKNNQQNLGTIKSSNLCCEITEYNTPDKYACCCLSSLILPTYVITKQEGLDEVCPYFDYKNLHDVVRVIVRNLDMTIDINFYPVPETEVSNMSERPLGIGVQGLADTFFKMRVPFDSKEAAVINKRIFETMYFAALTESCQLALEKGTYPSYNGSPASKGLLQFDLWNVQVDDTNWPWSKLKKDIAKYGLRNSLVIALMPTASTAQIFGTTVECFEPISSNVYTRRVLAGEFIVFNKYLTNDLIKLGLWSKSMANKLKKYKGSVQHIRSIPQDIKDLYKTAWEIKQKVLIDMSADRGPFVDQSQSLNLFFERPNIQNLTSAHLYGFKKGLKTGSYYIRSKPAAAAEAFTVDDISDDDDYLPKKPVNVNVNVNKEEEVYTDIKKLLVVPTVSTSVSTSTAACDMCSS